MKVTALKTIAGSYGTLARGESGNIKKSIADDLLKAGLVTAEDENEADEPEEKPNLETASVKLVQKENKTAVNRQTKEEKG